MVIYKNVKEENSDNVEMDNWSEKEQDAIKSL